MLLLQLLSVFWVETSNAHYLSGVYVSLHKNAMPEFPSMLDFWHVLIPRK